MVGTTAAGPLPAVSHRPRNTGRARGGFTECRRFVSPSGTPLGQLSCRYGHKIFPAPGKAPKLPVNREELVRSTQGALSNARLDTVRLMELRRAERAKEN